MCFLVFTLLSSQNLIYWVLRLRISQNFFFWLSLRISQNFSLHWVWEGYLKISFSAQNLSYCVWESLKPPLLLSLGISKPPLQLSLKNSKILTIFKDDAVFTFWLTTSRHQCFSSVKSILFWSILQREISSVVLNQHWENFI